MFDRLIKIQLLTFCILYPIWIHPETNFLSDLCIFLGSAVSLYFIYIHKKYLLQKEATPIFIILILILWVLIHLIAFSGNYPLQLKELQSIWKRIILATIFGFGFGLSFFYICSKKIALKFFYIALSFPVIIYYLKLILVTGSSHLNFSIPEYLRIYNTRISPYYIPKPEYLFITVPSLIFSYINLYGLIFYKKLGKYEIYNIAIIGLIIFMFFNQNMKSGIFFFLFSFLIFSILVAKKLILQSRPQNYYFRSCILVVMLGLVLATSVTHFNNNKSWKYLISDIKVGVDIDANQYWKYLDRDDNPRNEKGVEVSRTTYDRAAWMVSGYRLLLEHPLGYGLLEYSFSYLAREKWGGARVPQTHNSWLDFGLAFGFPGLLLILVSFFLTIILFLKNQKKYNSLHIRNYALLILISYIPIFFVSELDFKRVLPITFFWLAFSTGLNLLLSRKSTATTHV